jgi:hypothetical protein
MRAEKGRSENDSGTVKAPSLTTVTSMAPTLRRSPGITAWARPLRSSGAANAAPKPASTRLRSELRSDRPFAPVLLTALPLVVVTRKYRP